MRGDGDRFDVVILGGGAAGCVLAARLSEDPARRVCLVEAGPDYGHLDEGRWPPALLDARVDGALTYLRGGGLDPHDWGFDAGLSGIRAKVIGGCSSHNGCEALWGSPADYDAWATATGDASWGYEAFAPFLARAHATLRARPGTLAGLSAIRRALVGAGDRLGLPLLPDLNAPGALRGAGSIPVNAVGTLRWGAAFAYLDPARGRPNLTILADTLVDCVEIVGGAGARRAAGAQVIARGRARSIAADVVIVTAGSYATPAILGRSGIGDAADLRALSIEPVVDLPGVGQSLLDHPYVLLSWATKPRLAAADERQLVREVPLALSEIKWASSRCAPGSWDITIGAWSGRIFDQRAHQDVHLAGLAPCAMHAVSRGRVVLRSADPTLLPRIEHGLLTDPDGHDLAVLEDGVDLCRAVAATPEWRYWCGPENVPGPAATGGELRAWIRSNAAGTYHPCGTTRMGRDDDPGAVVDASGRVHGVASLVVADASIFPSIPAANIHVSVVAVAEKIGSDLAAGAA